MDNFSAISNYFLCEIKSVQLLYQMVSKYFKFDIMVSKAFAPTSYLSKYTKLLIGFPVEVWYIKNSKIPKGKKHRYQRGKLFSMQSILGMNRYRYVGGIPMPDFSHVVY